jgi:RsiW-degrading membrane proteinase PrsW (M82 family)
VREKTVTDCAMPPLKICVTMQVETAMPLWIIFAGILTPAIFWITYFCFKDRLQPEPFLKIGTAYLLGIGSALVVAQVLKFLPLMGLPDDPSLLMESQRLRYLLYSICITGLMEEFFKFLPFLVFVLNFRAFDEQIDGIIYASLIALGFASYENSQYLAYMDGWELLGRAFASPLTHTIFSSIWGYIVGSARWERRSLFWPSTLGIALAALFHGLFNFLTTSPVLRIGSSMLILAIWIWRIRLIEKLGQKR